MKLNLTEEMSFEKMTEVLKKELPQYEVSLKKNPLTKWQYVEVKKSGAVGVWVRTFPKKNEAWLIKAMPSALVRGLFGGLILILFVMGAQGRVQKEVNDVLTKAFNTTAK